MAIHVADFYGLTSSPVPRELHGADSKCAIRLLSPQERLQIEDRFFQCGRPLRLKEDCTGVVVSQSITRGGSIEECATLVEFALAVMMQSGFQSVNVAAVLQGTSCTSVMQRVTPDDTPSPSGFQDSLSGVAVSAWLRRLFDARRNTRDRMHITADRFVRYAGGRGVRDSLMDLCISLESVLDSQTEVSFRFGTCLAKVADVSGKKAEGTAKLLSDLYDLRSKIVHGADSTKELKKLEPHLPELRRIARTILTKYVLFMSEHSRADWRQHIFALLFA
jgi:hypothetical protein